MNSKPYIESIAGAPNEVSKTLEWAQYLGDTFGTSGALNALQYYERMDWIDESVQIRLSDYLRGLSLDELHNKKYEEPVTLTDPLDKLSGTPFGAHAKSLAYIADIADDDLQEQFILAQLADRRIERDLPETEALAADVESQPTQIGVSDD